MPTSKSLPAKRPAHVARQHRQRCSHREQAESGDDEDARKGRSGGRDPRAHHFHGAFNTRLRSAQAGKAVPGESFGSSGGLVGPTDIGRI